MNGPGESDNFVVPRKPTNNGDGRPASAERAEERGLAKGNAVQQNRIRTQRRAVLQRELERVRQVAERDKEARFTALWHHVYNIDRLREAYFSLKRDSAAGVDGQTWQEFGQGLEHRLAELSGRLQAGAYRARPVRRVYIPKPDGRQRPIGVTTLEDKIVQRATTEGKRCQSRYYGMRLSSWDEDEEMTRPGRVFVEGGFCHVYNRLGRGERVFAAEHEAAEFVRILKEVMERDGVTVLAWCLLSNHYHLAVRSGEVSLDRPMRSLQQRVTRGVNARQRVWGPLWQGRFKVKIVDSQRYLDSLLAYVHLNPVAAGIVDDPAEYRWSGHLELLGRRRKPIVDVDEVLRVFGRTRRSARAAYVRRIKGAIEEEWIGEEPGRLPWWRLGRPPKSELEDPENAVRQRREKEQMGPEWRPEVDVDTFVSKVSELLGLDEQDIRSRRRAVELVEAREILMTLGVGRYRLKVKEIAINLRKSPDGMSQALARGIDRRARDADFRSRLGELDREVAEAAG